MIESGLLDNVPERQEIIALVEDLILATDVSRHKDFMAQFEEMVMSPHVIDLNNVAERQFVLMVSITMHICTIYMYMYVHVHVHNVHVHDYSIND